MRDEKIPLNWDDMCKNSVDSATSDSFDLEDLWFKNTTDTLGYPVTDPFAENSGGQTLTSEVAANKHNFTKNIKGDNKIAADAIARKLLPNLSSMTGIRECHLLT